MSRHSWCLSALLVCCLWSLPAFGAAPLTLYGVFQQQPDGGIVFTCPQQPKVVYIPFDPGSIMSDVLGIQVQVRGEIRDSFVRDGKTMRILAVTAIKPLAAEYGETHVMREANVGLPGAGAAVVHAYPDRTCYLYPHYAVLERPATFSDGHSLRVLARHPEDDPSALCERLQGTPLFEIPNGGDFTFAGLSDDVLFVQNGSPKAIHGLMAVNVARRQQILNAVVVPGSTIAGRTLRYKETAAKGNGRTLCPNGKIATRPMTLDLVTGRSREIGKVGCWSLDDAKSTTKRPPAAGRE